MQEVSEGWESGDTLFRERESLYLQFRHSVSKPKHIPTICNKISVQDFFSFRCIQTKKSIDGVFSTNILLPLHRIEFNDV